MPDPFSHHLYEFGKWAPDEPEYGDSGLSLCHDLVYSSGMYCPRRSTATVNDAVAYTAVRGCKMIPQISTATAPLFFGAANSISYFDGTAAIVTLGGVAPAAATHWSFARFGDNVLCADVANPLKVSAALGVLANAITSVLKPRMRYITTIKTHLFGAFVDDGAAGAFNPSKFWWSAQNSVIDWQPGSNRAGFGEVRKDVGYISGVVGFEDFGVLFCRFGVYRIDYVGGDNVWSLRQIASGEQGLPLRNEDSICIYGTDIYYWSRGGPSVVVGGETVSPLGGGSVRRYLTERSWVAPNDAIICGAADAERPLIAWSWFAENAVPGGVVYNAAEQAWSTFTPPQNDTLTGRLLGMAPGLAATGALLAGGSVHPLDRVDFLVFDTVDIVTSRYRFSSDTDTFACKLATKIWMPYSSKRSMLHYMRILYRALKESGGAGDPAVVTPTITLERDSDPLFSAPASVGTPTQAKVDPNGYITGDGAGLPAEGHGWRMTLNIPSFQGILSSLAGLDLVSSPGSAIY